MLQNFLNKQLVLADLIKSEDETKGTVEFYYYDRTTPLVPFDIKIDRCGGGAKVWVVAKPKDGYKFKSWSDLTGYEQPTNRVVWGASKDLSFSAQFEAASVGDYLTFTNESDENNVLHLVAHDNQGSTLSSKKPLSARFSSLSYRLDNESNWTDIDLSQQEFSIQFLSSVQLKGLILYNYDYYFTIYPEKECSISGLLSSLYTNNNYYTLLKDINVFSYIYLFIYLFRNVYNVEPKIVSAKNLILPDFTDFVYTSRETFSFVYQETFTGQTRLQFAPAIPALPYINDFVVVFYKTFFGCSSLQNIISYVSSNVKTTNYFYQWLKDAASTVTNPKFYNLGGATFTRGDYGVPSNWTILTSLDEE